MGRSLDVRMVTLNTVLYERCNQNCNVLDKYLRFHFNQFISFEIPTARILLTLKTPVISAADDSFDMFFSFRENKF